MYFFHVVFGSIDNCSRDTIKLIEQWNISDNVEEFLLSSVALLIPHFII